MKQPHQSVGFKPLLVASGTYKFQIARIVKARSDGGSPQRKTADWPFYRRLFSEAEVQELGYDAARLIEQYQAVRQSMQAAPYPCHQSWLPKSAGKKDIHE